MVLTCEAIGAPAPQFVMVLDLELPSLHKGRILEMVINSKTKEKRGSQELIIGFERVMQLPHNSLYRVEPW
jgi:hypothetical protein